MGLTKPRAAQIYNLDYKQAARVVITTNITLAGGAPAVVDGVTLSANDRVLCTGQSNATQNLIYVVTTPGSGSNGTWVVASDDNATGELEAGTIVMITEGTTYADTQWKLITDGVITIGFTNLTWVQNYLANSISAGTSNVVVGSGSNVTISSAGVANVLTVSSTGIVVAGNMIPTANATYTLGNSTNVWKSLYVAGNSIYLGAVTLGSSGTALTVGGANVVTADSSGNVSTTGNVTGGNILASGIMSSVGNATHGNVLSNGLVSVVANVITGNILAGAYYYANGAAFTGGGGGTPGGANTYVEFNDNGLFGGTAGFTFNKTTNAVATTGTFSATSNITGGNILTAGIMSSTGNATHGNVLTGGLISAAGNITGNYLFGNASQVTGLSASKIFNGTSEANIGTSGGNANISIGGTSNVLVVASTGTYITGVASVSGNITGGNISAVGTVTTASTVGGVITGSTVSAAGNITGGNLSVGTGLVTLGGIINANGNAVGNIGSSTGYFNTVFAKATSAQYADLAEMYCADQDYSPGTVVDFGGDYEVTISSKSHSTAVAGIISTNPSYLMNSTLECKNSVAVALTGRVPCRVVGTIRKGDRMVSSGIPGVATALNPADYEPGCIIGKALEDYDSIDNGTIEVAVGRF